MTRYVSQFVVIGLMAVTLHGVCGLLVGLMDREIVQECVSKGNGEIQTVALRMYLM